MASAHCLASPTAEWRVSGVPLFSMMGALHTAPHRTAPRRAARLQPHVSRACNPRRPACDPRRPACHPVPIPGAERRAGEAIAAVRTHPVDLDGASFRHFAATREVRGGMHV